MVTRFYFMCQIHSLPWLPEVLRRTLKSCLTSKGLSPMIHSECLPWTQEGWYMDQALAIPGLSSWISEKNANFTCRDTHAVTRQELIHLENEAQRGGGRGQISWNVWLLIHDRVCSVSGDPTQGEKKQKQKLELHWQQAVQVLTVPRAPALKIAVSSLFTAFCF